MRQKESDVDEHGKNLPKITEMKPAGSVLHATEFYPDFLRLFFLWPVWFSANL
jgi:hypothetical protein